MEDIVYSGKVLTRRYVATKSPNDYVIDEMQAALPGFKKGKALSASVFSALLNGEQNEKELLDELEKLVDKRKKELDQEE